DGRHRRTPGRLGCLMRSSGWRRATVRRAMSSWSRYLRCNRTFRRRRVSQSAAPATGRLYDCRWQNRNRYRTMPQAVEGSPDRVSRRPTGSWRARRQDSPPAGRRVRRILAGLSIVALLAFFAYLLLDPLGRPKAALVVARPIGEI